MEYKLNKIDMEIRQRINEETSEGKVHAKKGISIQENKERKNREQSSNKRKSKDESNEQKHNTKKITVYAEKVENLIIDAEKEADSLSNSDNKGMYIDVRK